ncbi:MAG: response regulator [Bacteroidota bacterium]
MNFTEHQPHHASSNYLVVHSDREYLDLIGNPTFFDLMTPKQCYGLGPKAMNIYKGLIIFCELLENKEGQKVFTNEHYGIKLAQCFRREFDLRCPILFTSCVSRKELTQNKLDRAIVNSIGHDFLRLPCHLNEWLGKLKDMEPLSDLEMNDIKRNYCNNYGLAQLEIHDLSKLSTVDHLPLIKFREALEKSIQRIYALFDQSPIAILKEIELKFDLQSADSRVQALNFVEMNCRRITNENVPEVKQELVVQAKHRWTLLLLDDEIGKNALLIKGLERRGVQVLCAQNAEEAWALLNEDEFDENRITLVLSDYRLEQKSDGVVKVHQKIQGYRFLEELSKNRRHLSLAALSALPRKFLIESFDHFSVRVSVYPKRDYLENESTLNILCDELVSKGDENYEAIARLLRVSTENWRYYEPFYLAHRNSINYKNNEHYIARRAKEYCNGVVNGNILFDLEGYTRELKGNKKIPSNPKAFKEFLNKMICRRVVLWYSRYQQTTSPKKIHSILKGRNYKGNETDSAAKNQVITNLALPVSDFPWNMTLEEKYGLVRDMGMKEIALLEKEERQILERLERKTLEWYAEQNLFQKEIAALPPNTYGRIKSILNRVSIILHEQPKLIDEFQKLVSILRGAMLTQYADGNPSNLKSSSSNLMYRFFVGLMARNRRFKSLPLNVPLKASMQEIKEKTIEHVLKKIGANKRVALTGIAFEFFYQLEQDEIHYQSITEYAKKLLQKYQSEECLVNYKSVSLESISNLRKFSDDINFE